MRPVLAEGGQQGVQRLWKHAVLAQEDGMQLHFRTLPTAAGARRRVVAFESPADGWVVPDDEWSAVKS